MTLNIQLDVALRRILTQSLTLKKPTESIEESTFGTVSKTWTDYAITGALYPNTYDETMWARDGGFRKSDARGYFFSSYTIGEDTVYVEEGDHVLKGTELYSILRLYEHSEFSSTIRSAFLVRVDV